MSLESHTIAGTGDLLTRGLGCDRFTARVAIIPPDLTYLEVSSASRVQRAN